MDFSLELNEEQLKIISKALDIFVQLNQGQVLSILNPYLVSFEDADYHEAKDKALELKTILFPELEELALYTIRSKKVPHEAKVAADISAVLDHTLKPSDTKPEFICNDVTPPKITIKGKYGVK